MGTPYCGKTDYYFEMSDAITEDYALRQKLALRRLEEVCENEYIKSGNFSVYY